jgi:RHS repeat-associated protein
MSISGTSTINGTTESASYTYDNLGRIVTSNQTSNGSSAQRRFAYDRWGNRTGVWDATSGGTQIQSITLQQSGTAPTNQIASVTSGSTVNYLYDAAGNVTNDGAHSYGYDSDNRIVSVDGGATASYAYDQQNRRYKKTVSSTVTHYLWLGSQLLAEHNGSTGAMLTDYIYSGGRMIGKVMSGTPQYFLSDRLSIRLTLDSAGNVVGRQAHLPFGEDFAESGTQEKHHFTTYERDNENGTDYATNRQYSQTIGRFNRPDPYNPGSKSIDPQGLNRYNYVKDDPIGLIDPAGLDAFAPGDGWYAGWQWNWFWYWSGWFEGPNLNTPPDEGPNIPVIPPPQIVYTDLSWRVDSFFASKVNCESYFLGLGIWDSFLSTARDAKYVDFTFWNNRILGMAYTFAQLGFTSNALLRGESPYLWLMVAANATTWDPENTITVGAALYEPGTTEYSRNRTIIHEVLHLFYHKGFHRDLASIFLPGGPNFGSENDAKEAINKFLDSDCTDYR